jgi:hypothetical protein
MKKHTLRLVLTLIVTSISFSQFAQAQSNRHLIANIPFQFQQGERVLPAGAYEVSQVGSNSYVLRSQSTGTSTLLKPSVSIMGNSTQQSGKLLFHRYGDRSFLSQIWKPADQLGLELPTSRAEKQIQRKVTEKQLVSIALHR